MLAKQMDGVAQELVTSPALMALAMFARDFGDRRRAGQALETLRSALEALAIIADLG